MSRSIAIVHNAYGKVSGEEIAIENLVSLLKIRDIIVHPFCRSSAEIEDTKLAKIPAFFSGIYNPFSRKAFCEFLKEKRPDVVHIHNLYPLISPSILPVCKTMGVPLVMTVHNFRLVCPNGLLLSKGEICHRCLGGREYWCVLRNCENSFFKSTGYALRTATARILRSYYDNVDHFICLSEFQKNILVGEGLPADRASVMVNPLSFSAETIHQKGRGGYVAYVGRISPEKDILTLLEAARRLDDVPFKFAGDYHRMSEVVKQIPVNCEFLGQLNAGEIDKFYRNARMVVFATRCYEGFPTVLMEAMSHGLPLICSRIGGLPEIVENGVNGLLYEPGNADELAARIQMLWQDTALCEKLGNAGRNKVREEYAPENLMNRLMGIYEKVIKQVKGV